jgi:type I restriction enzyme S subunit
MELITKQGYKQTEVGLIPEDWDALELNELGATGRPVIKAGPFGSSLKKEFYVSDGYKIYGQEQVIKNDPFYGNYFIDKERYRKLKSCKVLPGDILLSLVGTFGKVLVIPEKALKGIINPRLLRISVDKNKFHTKYISYFLRSTKAIGILESKLQGGTMGVLNASILKSFQIPLPPTLTEQKAIATALSDVDALITSLEQTITKKKAIKQGAMQQLLTPPHKGGKRLPGFEGECVEKTLGEISSMNSGGTPSSKVSEYYDGNIKWVSISDITKAGKYIDDSAKKITEKGLQNSSARLFPINTLLLAMYASIGKCCIARAEVTTSQAILGITTTKSLLLEFLYYYLTYKQDEIANQGQQGTQSNLNKGMVQDILINIPAIEEQKAIAQILSDMDAEITQLETKKEKYQAIKQGMMQELLTGKTRLI